MVDEALAVMEESNLFDEQTLADTAQLNLRYIRGRALHNLDLYDCVAADRHASHDQQSDHLECT